MTIKINDNVKLELKPGAQFVAGAVIGVYTCPGFVPLAPAARTLYLVSYGSSNVSWLRRDQIVKEG